jgi:hypothetical protein
VAVSKQEIEKFGVERFDLKNLGELHVMEQYHIKFSITFTALKNINRAWENIKEYIRTSVEDSLCLYELQQHKPRFDEECFRFSDQRKQAKMQWIQGPNESNVDNLNYVRRETSRNFRNKKKEYQKAKIDDIELKIR